MNLVNIHQSLRRRGLTKKTIRAMGLIYATDALVYIVAIISMLCTLDQAWIIWVQHNAAGVSFLTWALYTVAAVAWLFYGFVHRERAIILTNFIWILINLSIVVGLVVYQ